MAFRLAGAINILPFSWETWKTGWIVGKEQAFIRGMSTILTTSRQSHRVPVKWLAREKSHYCCVAP